MDTWAPMFAINMGIPRVHLLDLSVRGMVDHVDYWAEMMGSRNG